MGLPRILQKTVADSIARYPSELSFPNNAARPISAIFHLLGLRLLNTSAMPRRRCQHDIVRIPLTGGVRKPAGESERGLLPQSRVRHFGLFQDQLYIPILLITEIV